MRVLIDTTYARRAPLSGTAVYLERLCEELGRLDGVDPVGVANVRRRPPAGGGAGSARNAIADTWWTAVMLPRLARRMHADLIHHPLPAWAPRAGVRQVVTVADLAFERLPGCFDPAFRRYAHVAHRAAARAAAAVICVSETTARDAVELWAVPRERIVVAPHGPGQELPPGPRADDPRHFLYVGDAEPRKNLDVLLDAYARYRGAADRPLELVVAGTATIPSLPGVRVLGRQDRAALAALYLGAAALVHPSLYEGFGLTLVEAMRMGTPVVAAPAPGVSEVCGDAVQYAEGADAFAAAMARIAGDGAVRAGLSRRGRARAAEFSWGACARLHADAYSLALGA
jgi:glycosyltransferase involved in cell wall biosynthesis